MSQRTYRETSMQGENLLSSFIERKEPRPEEREQSPNMVIRV